MTSNRWLSIRLEFLGGLLILATAINCVILRNSLSASAAGFIMLVFVLTSYPHDLFRNSSCVRITNYSTIKLACTNDYGNGRIIQCC